VNRDKPSLDKQVVVRIGTNGLLCTARRSCSTIPHWNDRDGGWPEASLQHRGPRAGVHSRRAAAIGQRTKPLAR
jgi:hypothetical protein